MSNSEWVVLGGDVELPDAPEEQSSPAKGPVAAKVHVRFPVIEKVASESLVQELRWWNTHYKAPHVFQGGRVEVLFDRNLKGYDARRELVKYRCPNCTKQLSFWPQSLHAVNGHVCCPFCKKHHGVSPRGQLFVVRDVPVKSRQATVDKAALLKWAKQNAYYHDWEYETDGEGVEITLSRKNDETLEEGLGELRSLLDSKGWGYTA